MELLWSTFGKVRARAYLEHLVEHFRSTIGAPLGKLWDSLLEHIGSTCGASYEHVCNNIYGTSLEHIWNTLGAPLEHLRSTIVASREHLWSTFAPPWQHLVRTCVALSIQESLKQLRSPCLARREQLGST
jgi:hypothetical protein